MPLPFLPRTASGAGPSTDRTRLAAAEAEYAEPAAPATRPAPATERIGAADDTLRMPDQEIISRFQRDLPPEHLPGMQALIAMFLGKIQDLQQQLDHRAPATATAPATSPGPMKKAASAVKSCFGGAAKALGVAGGATALVIGSAAVALGAFSLLFDGGAILLLGIGALCIGKLALDYGADRKDETSADDDPLASMTDAEQRAAFNEMLQQQQAPHQYQPQHQPA